YLPFICSFPALFFFKMLSQMLKDHNQRQAVCKEAQERLKNEAIVAAHNLSSAVVDHLNSKVGVAYHNEKKLDVEAKRFDQNSNHLTRHTEQWMALAESLNDALKEVGDVEHWTRMMECDLEQIVETLKRVAEESKRSPSAEETATSE
ncbi:hypothetical protein PMAYCL1PPCAC_11999, partial [Pristionchus mayeri]